MLSLEYQLKTGSAQLKIAWRMLKELFYLSGNYHLQSGHSHAAGDYLLHGSFR